MSTSSIEDDTTPQTVREALEADADIILSLRRFQEATPIQDQDEAKRFFASMGYLLEKGHNIVTLISTYQECAQSGDYTALAKMALQQKKSDAEARIETAPDGYSKDPMNPGKSQLTGVIERWQKRLANLETNRPNGIIEVEVPSLESKPIWVTAVEQSEMSYPEIWQLLEKGST